MYDEEVKPAKYWGKHKGYVRDNNDPENRGRIRCYCPQVMGQFDDPNHWLDWALPNFPWLGGLNTLDFGSPAPKSATSGPEIGVWIEFENGDVEFPIWTGTWIPALTVTDPYAQQNLDTAGGEIGGDIITNPPGGSNLGALNPPQPQVNTNETRLLVKKGREIMIGSVEGGYILLGPYGVAVSGVQVLLNGRFMTAATSDSVTG